MLPTAARRYRKILDFGLDKAVTFWIEMRIAPHGHRSRNPFDYQEVWIGE